MKIVFYGARYVGMVVLSYLVARGFDVKVIPEDDDIRDVCRYLKLEVVTFDTMGEYDLFLCCHGKKIIDEKYLVEGKFINIHPTLFKYKGHNPIKRYMINGDTKASVESHYMVKEVDAGKVLVSVFFKTPEISTFGEFYNLAIPYYFKCIHETIDIYSGIIEKANKKLQ